MLQVDCLSKSFGPLKAVNNVSFQISPGEICALLGPNGAGKSTTLRLVTGWLSPDSGTIRVNDIPLASNPVAARRQFGYLAENNPLYRDLSVLQFLEFCGSARGLSGKTLRGAIARASSLCSLQDVLHVPIEFLSKGFRQRVGIAQAILHSPPLLILDEPTDGLDPNQKHLTRALLQQLAESCAILFSTHILEEVSSVCSRAILMHQGQILHQGTPAQLAALSPDNSLSSLFLKATSV